MLPDRKRAEEELAWAGEQNPGIWVDHSNYVAMACEHIASRISERHLIEGYRRCMEHGWDEAAKICISHAFMIQDIGTSIGIFDMPEEDRRFMEQFIGSAVYDDYDRLVQLCDSLALPSGFCLLEKRFVDVTLRYGTHPSTVPRWKKILEIKEYFEARMGCGIYDLLPGVRENTFL